MVRLGLAECLDEYLSLREKARVVELTSEEAARQADLRNVLNHIRLPWLATVTPNRSDAVSDQRAADAEAQHLREVSLGRAKPWVPPI